MSLPSLKQRLTVGENAEVWERVATSAKQPFAFEFQYEAPPTYHAEASGHRIMVSPKTSSKRDRFLTVFQMTAGDTEPLDVEFTQSDESYVVSVADRVV